MLTLFLISLSLSAYLSDFPVLSAVAGGLATLSLVSASSRRRS